MNNGYEYMVDQLIKQRYKLSWSQEELAHKIGCTKSLIHKWEQYKRMPSGFMLGCWVDALGLQINLTEKCQTSEAQSLEEERRQTCTM